MPLNLPDPRQVAREEAQRIISNREQFLRFPIDRILTDARQITRRDLLAGLTDFHRERMGKIPSAAIYPEAPPWIDHALAVDRELQSQANLSDEDLAVVRSLGPYVSFRAFSRAAGALRHQPAGDEKCRVAYVPDTDRGEVAIKNVDDPITHWKPDPQPPRSTHKLGDLRSDGVGNGLHMDTEPDEIFPLRPLNMLAHYANDVPSAVQFLTRYSKFWGGANMLLHDRQKRSVAIEKCSYSFIEVFPAGADGKSHISGMTCRDPNSPQGSHQRRQRQGYVDLFNLGDDCPDLTFWATCAKFEVKLSSGLAALGPRPRCDELVKLFTDPWPQGLNKYGLRIHPQQGLVGYTLMTCATLITERKFLRWQRSATGESFDAQPQECAIPG